MRFVVKRSEAGKLVYELSKRGRARAYLAHPSFLKLARFLPPKLRGPVYALASRSLRGRALIEFEPRS